MTESEDQTSKEETERKSVEIEWAGGGASSHIGDASGTWEWQQPSKHQQVDTQGLVERARPSMRVIPLGASGNEVALTFTLDPDEEEELPPTLTVGINGRAYDAIDVWRVLGAGSSGSYMLPGRFKGQVPLRQPAEVHVNVDGTMYTVPAPIKPVDDASATGRPGIISLDFNVVPCPPDCESILFGTSCVICIEFDGFSVG